MGKKRMGRWGDGGKKGVGGRGGWENLIIIHSALSTQHLETELGTFFSLLTRNSERRRELGIRS
uniref:Uncharacterized protein n=1 Tax=Desertifilum tharense IPPAS B-1220 TaxID=1781255 RepID=A0ACD5GXV2_9CYAN